LKGQHSTALEADVSLEVVSNSTHQALEGQLADEQLCEPLVLPDFLQGLQELAAAL
jgi:hypothetical protein